MNDFSTRVISWQQNLQLFPWFSEIISSLMLLYAVASCSKRFGVNHVVMLPYLFSYRTYCSVRNSNQFPSSVIGMQSLCEISCPQNTTNLRVHREDERVIWWGLPYAYPHFICYFRAIICHQANTNTIYRLRAADYPSSEKGLLLPTVPLSKLLRTGV